MTDNPQAQPAPPAATPLLEVRNLRKHFPLPGGWLTRQRRVVHAVDDVSFVVQRGEALGLVGESGCGKTTLGRLILRLAEPTAGEIFFAGQPIAGLSKAALRPLRPKLQVVFQNPLQSLSPRLRVFDIVAEPLRTHGAVAAGALRGHVVELLEQVGLGAQHLDRFPHEISGGQCQRVAIARALALEPQLLVLDEPTSALDVSVQAQILNLLNELRRRLGLTYLFISHDLSVVEYISDRIAVMYLGEIVEIGPSASIFAAPRHPYTQALLSAVPEPDLPVRRELVVLEGNVPSPANPPSGCRFHTRCPLAFDLCRQRKPALEAGEDPTWLAACHLLVSRGVSKRCVACCVGMRERIT